MRRASPSQLAFAQRLTHFIQSMSDEDFDVFVVDSGFLPFVPSDMPRVQLRRLVLESLLVSHGPQEEPEDPQPNTNFYQPGARNRMKNRQSAELSQCFGGGQGGACVPRALASRMLVEDKTVPYSGVPTTVLGHLTLQTRLFAIKFTPLEKDLVVASQSDQIHIFRGRDVVSQVGYAKPKRVITALDVQYSILDVDVSFDDRLLLYTTWSDAMRVVRLGSPDDDGVRLTLGPHSQHVATFAGRFSADARHVLSGNNGKRVIVIDVERNAPIFDVLAHRRDCNTVAYLEKHSHVFASAGDDAMVKLWDARVGTVCVGVLPGHMDGVCYLDPRNDGRHILSTAKDQAIKLWDVRKALPSAANEEGSVGFVHRNGPAWDYRGDDVPGEFDDIVHPKDCSVMTYSHGHALQRTLIRAKFGPDGNTVLTGSSDGAVVVYDGMTGEVVRRVRCHLAVVRDFAVCQEWGLMCTAGFDGTVAVVSTA